jgi:hypothetical protein
MPRSFVGIQIWMQGIKEQDKRGIYRREIHVLVLLEPLVFMFAFIRAHSQYFSFFKLR